MDELLKAKDLAKVMNVNVETVRRWTRSGDIPVITFGRSKRYRLADVMAALDEGKE